MRCLSFISLFLLFTSNVFATIINTTATGIPLDTEWKQKIYEFAKANVKHSAWGIAHSERNYHMSLALAEQERVKVDSDILFAAAFFHDIGAIEPYRKIDVEHATRSVEVAEPILQSYGFPMQKWSNVKATILSHMYDANEKPITNESIMLHDADALDFFGAIGIVRLVSITEKHVWAKNLAGAFTTLNQFETEIPSLLITKAAKKIAAQRIAEMDQVISSLNQETFAGKAL